MLTPDTSDQLNWHLYFLNRRSSCGLRDLSFKRIVNDVENHRDVSCGVGLISLVGGEACNGQDFS